MCCLFFIFPFPPASLRVIWQAGSIFPSIILGLARFKADVSEFVPDVVQKALQKKVMNH